MRRIATVIGTAALLAVMMLRFGLVRIARPLAARVLRAGSRRPAGLWLALGSASAAVLGLLLFVGFAPIGGYEAALTGSLRQAIEAPPTHADLGEELDCLARNVYFEARGEPDEGKVAVAHVVMNRAANGRFPDTVCEVVRQGGEKVRHKCQFSWWCDGRSDEPSDAVAWSESREVARLAYWGYTEDPTAGALWYHATRVKPVWRKALVRGRQIGDHIFYVAPGAQTQLASSADGPSD